MTPYKLESTGLFFKPQRMTWAYGKTDPDYPATAPAVHLDQKVHLIWWLHPRQNKERLMALAFSKADASMVAAAPQLYQELRRAILHRLYPDQYPDFDLNKALLAIAKVTSQEPELVDAQDLPPLPDWVIKEAGQ